MDYDANLKIKFDISKYLGEKVIRNLKVIIENLVVNEHKSMFNLNATV